MHSCSSLRLRRGFIAAGFQILLGTVQLGGSAGLLWYQWRGEVEIREATAALEAAGYSTDPLAACPPDVPDEGNFGNAEPLRGISVNEKEQTPEIKARIKALEALKHNTSSYGSGVTRMPELSADKPVDWSAFRTWLRDGMKWKVPEGEQDDARAVLHALNARCAGIQPALIENAKRATSFSFVPSQRETHAAALRSEAVLLPVSSGSTSALVSLLRLVVLQTEAALVCGEKELATELLRLQCAVGRLFWNETSLVSFLIGTTADRMIIDSAWRGISAGVLSEEQLSILQQYAATQDHLESAWGRAMKSELVFATHVADQFVKQRYPLSALRSFDWQGHDLKNRATPFEVASAAAILRRYRAILIRNFLAMEAKLKSEDSLGYWQSTQSVFNARKRKLEWLLDLQPHRILARAAQAPFASLVPRAAWTFQMKRALQIACAIERHRLAGAAVPETLAELPAELLPRIPRDLDGKPLHYQREGSDGWVIWSVGLDGKDDWQGAMPPAKPRRMVPEEPYQKADWQWRMIRLPL